MPASGPYTFRGTVQYFGMSTLPLDIPAAVIDWIRNVFEQVNKRTATTLSRIPTMWETTLDQILISHLAEFSAPFRFPSNWVVTLDTHFLGGRIWGQWEIADIGFLVVFRRAGKVVATKIALLQSKRLYPDEVKVATDIHRIDYMVGFGRLLQSDGEYNNHVKQRTFTFSEQSKYQALDYGGEQYNEILNYTRKHGIPVHYQLYNPLLVPSSAELPASVDSTPTSSELQVGCRVVNAASLDTRLQSAGLRKLQNPSFSQIAGLANSLAADCWPLHYFVADLVLGCKEGHLAGTVPEPGEPLFAVFNQRTAPISAAISININAPGEGG